jgi:hypothetical protein
MMDSLFDVMLVLLSVFCLVVVLQDPAEGFDGDDGLSTEST